MSSQFLLYHAREVCESFIQSLLLAYNILHVFLRGIIHIHLGGKGIQIHIFGFLHVFVFNASLHAGVTWACIFQIPHFMKVLICVGILYLPLCWCLDVCICVYLHGSSLPIMYIEFCFCSLYLSAPIWQMHINRWSIEERERAEQGNIGGLEGQWGWRLYI